MSPLGAEEKIIEYTNSLGLRYKKEVIGWMITHRIAPDTIRYTSLYVDPEYQYKGPSIRLLIESMVLQTRSTIKWALFEINLDQINPSWYKFVQKRLAPYSQKITEIYKTWKQLNH